MDRVTALTRDCFNSLNQLRALSGQEVTSPAALHRRVADLVNRLSAAAREQGVPERDAQDMAYALVALADEIALSKAGAMAGYWRDNKLQVQFFDENTAGEGFFRRLQALRQDHRRVSVLRVYHLCLLFGFEGMYVGRGEGELRRLTESVGEELARQLDPPAELSPDGGRPDDALLRRRERQPLLWAAVAALAVSFAIYVVLRVVLDGQTDEVVEQLHDLKAAPVAESGRWGRP